jgi:hypothetical protein
MLKSIRDKGERELLTALVTPSIPKAQPTMIFDEPEANFGLEWQARLWQTFEARAQQGTHQIIVVSHSPFALGIHGAHYVLTDPKATLEAERLLVEKFGMAALKKMVNDLEKSAEEKGTKAPSLGDDVAVSVQQTKVPPEDVPLKTSRQSKANESSSVGKPSRRRGLRSS